PMAVRRVISTRSARTTTELLRRVVEEEGGTGTKARLEEFPVAGKTGTAQKVDPTTGGYSSKRIGSFAGFVPADEPRAVILVLIDEPSTSSYGGVVAAPVFRAIAAAVLKRLGVEPPAPTVVARAPRAVPATPRAKPASREAATPANAETPSFLGLSLREALARAQSWRGLLRPPRAPHRRPPPPGRGRGARRPGDRRRGTSGRRQGPRRPRARCPSRAGRGGRPLRRRSERRPRSRRRHRHQRQDEHHVHPRVDLARGRPRDRRDRYGRLSRCRPARSAGAAHDARGARPPGAARRDASRRRDARGDGGVVARARPGARARLPLRRRRVHQPHPRPSRLPRRRRELLP